MITLTGKILDGENVIFDGEINLSFVPPSNSGLIEWYGDFSISPCPTFNIGDSFHLVFSDGRNGEILIQQINDPSPASVHFLGNGVLS